MDDHKAKVPSEDAEPAQDQGRSAEKGAEPGANKQRRPLDEQEEVDEASKESFPTSDPPAW